ncbi:MAG: glycosyltransferase family 2 protein [Nostoc sp. NMS1]|nr:glycosyltransferase family 2 protein [Nostoc sp. NMS1]
MFMDIPEVTVIMPAYNTEAYISQAIESVLGQTLKNLELIVVDDASTDKTLAIAQNFTDDRLKIIASPKNLGPSGARNLAIKEAKGKWIAILDSDDWYLPERLEKLLQVADAENADMVADDLYYIKDGDKTPWNTLIAQSGEQIDTIKEIDSVYYVETDLPGRGGLTVGLTKPVIKREFLVKNNIEYDESIRLSEDFWFYLKCLAYKARFIFVPTPYYFYRSRLGSLVASTNKVKRLEETCNISKHFLEQDFIKTNPQLFKALSRRLALLEKTRPYFRVLDAIKSKSFSRTLVEMANNPYFFVHLAKQSPQIISRRINYFSSKYFSKYSSVDKHLSKD